MKSYTANEYEYIKDLIELILQFNPKIERSLLELLEGLGCVISDKYYGLLKREKGRTQELYTEIDVLMEKIGLVDDSILIKVMMLLNRKQTSNF